MTGPTPTVESRLAALEAAMTALGAQAAQLQVERDALAARLTLLEETAGRGLADLEKALADLAARRPPVRRELAELKRRVEELPTAEGIEEDVTHDPHQA